MATKFMITLPNIGPRCDTTKPKCLWHRKGMYLFTLCVSCLFTLLLSAEKRQSLETLNQHQFSLYCRKWQSLRSEKPFWMQQHHFEKWDPIKMTSVVFVANLFQKWIEWISICQQVLQIFCTFCVGGGSHIMDCMLLISWYLKKRYILNNWTVKQFSRTEEDVCKMIEEVWKLRTTTHRTVTNIWQNACLIFRRIFCAKWVS